MMQDYPPTFFHKTIEEDNIEEVELVLNIEYELNYAERVEIEIEKSYSSSY